MPTVSPSARFHWQVAPDPSQEMLDAVNCSEPLHPLIARIAAQRIPSPDDVARWFNALKEPLCDPFVLQDVEKAVQRLREAIANQEPITVFGDYDTDGITATTLIVQALTHCGAIVKPFIPDRNSEGYGLTSQAIVRCLSQAPFPKVLLTVDCGISSVSEVADLNARGIDVIITDHHVLPEVLPPAYAIVNPRRCVEPALQNMCGCATAFTVIRALIGDNKEHNYRSYLDLVAVATIADVMPLLGENRLLVKRGLWLLNNPSSLGNPGLTALLQAQTPKVSQNVTSETVAFNIVPCINAASRIGHFEQAYNLLNAFPSTSQTTTKARSAKETACQEAVKQLLEANAERRKIEKRLRDHIDHLQLQPVGNLVIAFGSQEEGFEPGVLGIVAARLADKYHLSAVVCCVKPDGSASGSMRTKGQCDAVKALDTVADLCEHYGGHKAAAGFALKVGAFEDFRERLPNAFVSDQEMVDVKVYDADMVEPIDQAFYEDMVKLEPFGAGNPRPIFAKHFILQYQSKIGVDKTHLRLTLKDANHPSIPPYNALWFGGAKYVQSWVNGMRLRLFFTLTADKLNPRAWQLCIEDAIPVP